MDHATVRQQQTNLDLLVAFEAEMDTREQSGVVIALPESEARFKSMQQQEGLRDLIWQRLYSLGYAPQANLKPTLAPATRVSSTSRFVRREILETMEEKYARVVKKFQADVGNTEDGWVGLQTWQCLQQLFNFEHDANLQKWLNPNYRNKYQKVFYRAVHLRMIMLGIANKPTGGIRASGNTEHISQLLQDWRQWLIRSTQQIKDAPTDLAFTSENTPDVITSDSPDIAVIEYLFDIDKLTRLIAAHLHLSEPITTTFFTAEKLKNISKCLLKIELWLYGVKGIEPGARGTLSQISYVPLRKKQRKGNALSKAVSEFLDEAGVSVVSVNQNGNLDASQKETLLMKLAFRHLNLLDHPLLSISPETPTQIVMTRINELQQEHKQRFEQDIQKSSGWGAWFFDGIKRLVRKIKHVWDRVRSFLTGLSDQVKDVIKTLADATKKLASESFSILKRSFKTLNDGFHFIAQREIVDRKHWQIGFQKDRDMDLIVFVANNADPQHIQRFWQYIDTRMLRTKAAMVIANALVELIVEVVTSAMSGMIGFLVVLLKLHSMLDNDEVELIKQAYLTYE